MMWRQQRRFPRMRCEHPIRVKLLGSQPSVEFGTTRVIGLGGCMFTSDRSIGYRSLLELQIPMPGGMVSADGRVAYEIRKREGEFEVGVEFLRLSQAHRARIRSLFPERSPD